MKLELWHGPQSSAIIAGDTTIQYDRKIHKYESDGDYQTLVTELKTYGVKAAQSVATYLASVRSNA